MQALAKLIEASALDQWIIRVAGQEHVLANAAIFEAAARAPLTLDDDGPTLDPSEVLRLALLHSEEEGRA
jgi:hypothetical protein